MKKNSTMKGVLTIVACAACIGASAQKQYPEQEKMKPGMSEYWTPQPRIVTPGCITTNSAPSDAIVLFDGKDLSAWESAKGGPAEWDVHDGVFTVNKQKGDIRTKQKFGDFQLHIEWCVPENITGTSQGRGNSGVFLQDKYEIQVLDCYNNETYVNGQTGSVYKQTPPLVNAMRKPGEWNVYDIIYSLLGPDFQGRRHISNSSESNRNSKRYCFTKQYNHIRNDTVYRFPESGKTWRRSDPFAIAWRPK